MRSNEHVLPYRVFDEDQRVGLAAVVENNRLGHALSRIKMQGRRLTYTDTYK